MEQKEIIEYITPELNEILVKKEYNFKIDKKAYQFIMSIDDVYIYFMIKQLRDIKFCIYDNKYDKSQIIKLLKLNVFFYNDLKKIIELLDQAYLYKKIAIIFDERNDNFHINIILPIGFQEYNSKIILKKRELDNNQKFDFILNEINLIKKDKTIDNKIKILLKSLSDLMISSNTKNNKNLESINLLKSTIINNEKILNSNKKLIESLKNEILILKDIVLKKNIDNNKNDIDNDKKDIDSNNKSDIDNNNKNYIDNNNKKDNGALTKENKEKSIRNKSFEKIIYNIEKISSSLASLKFNIMFFGNSGVGKTSIIEKYLSKPFSNFSHTGIYQNTINLKINDTVISIMIWDPPGQERFESLRKKNLKNQDLIVFVYSIISNDSLMKITELIEETKEYCKCNTHYVLIGSMADLEKDRKISYKQGKELAIMKNIDGFIEVSAHIGYNIDKMFFEIAKILYINSQK